MAAQRPSAAYLAAIHRAVRAGALRGDEATQLLAPYSLRCGLHGQPAIATMAGMPLCAACLPPRKERHQ
jgi:hypothetical protein